MSTTDEEIAELLQQALCELAACYDADVAPTRGGSSSRLVATVGCIGARLHGTLSLYASDVALSASLRVAAKAEPTPELLADWSGELGNQLSGRLKNKLLRHGLIVTLSLPAVTRTREAPHELAPPEVPGMRFTHLVRRVGDFEAALELCFDTSLATLGEEVVAIMHEGEMVYL